MHLSISSRGTIYRQLPCFLHGDLHASNILGYGGTLSNHPEPSLPAFIHSIERSHCLLPLVKEGFDMKALTLAGKEDLIRCGISIGDALVIENAASKLSPSSEQVIRKWKPQMIVDFGDTCRGDPMFDLVPVFVSVLQSSPLRLAKLLRTYPIVRKYFKLQLSRHNSEHAKHSTRVQLAGLPSDLQSPTPNLPEHGKTEAYRLFCLLLLHPVNTFRTIHKELGWPVISNCATLNELCTHILGSPEV